MTEQRFACTSCGKCCYGWVPLTIQDALANADRFPLAMTWTPVRQTNKAYTLATQIGARVQLPHGKQAAVLIMPTAYLPPSFPCPALSSTNLCSIHDEKPLRCRTMPFFPYREEGDQLDLLVPRKDWLCDVSQNAPVVYQGKKILDRENFDIERAELLAQAPALQAYAAFMLKQNKTIGALLTKAATTPVTGRFVISFSSLLSSDKKYDIIGFAKKQYPVLKSFADKTASLPEMAEYHRYYQNAATELEWFFKMP